MEVNCTMEECNVSEIYHERLRWKKKHVMEESNENEALKYLTPVGFCIEGFCIVGFCIVGFGTSKLIDLVSGNMNSDPG